MRHRLSVPLFLLLLPACSSSPTSVQITMEPKAGQAPVEIAFTATLDKEATDANVVASWDFGDSSAKGAGMSVTHTYADGGEFPVRVEVTGDGFGPLVATAVLTLEAPPYPTEPGVFVAQASGPLALNESSGTVGARVNALGNRLKISFNADFGKGPDAPDYYARKLAGIVDVQNPGVVYLHSIDDAQQAEVYAASRIPQEDYKKKMYIDPTGFYKRLPEAYTHKFDAKQEGALKELKPGLYSLGLSGLAEGDYAVKVGERMWGFRVKADASAPQDGGTP